MFSSRNVQRQAANLLRAGGRRIDSFAGRDNFTPAPTGKSPNALQLLQAYGNPVFDAQFDIRVQIKYFTESSGTYTAVAASAIASSLKTSLAAFIFGNSDMNSGYAKLQGQYPVSVWAYGDMFIYGRDLPRSNFSNLDATAKAVLSKGDVVFPFWATTAGPVNTVALVIVRSSSVPYANLLQAPNSDIFYTNMIRYTIDSTLVAQYNNAIGIYKISLFGKMETDTINPNSFKMPEQQQAGIIDMATVQGVDKNKAWATYVDYTAIDFTLQVFANGVDKLRA